MTLRAYKRRNERKRIRAYGGCLWLSEAKKDVTSCDKLRGLANTNRSVDIRMGQPNTLKMYYHLIWGERGELKHLSTHRSRK